MTNKGLFSTVLDAKKKSKIEASIEFLSVEDPLPGMQVTSFQCILAEWKQVLTLLYPCYD